MMMPAGQWARQTFGGSELGDKRRTERLVKVASGLAGRVGQSLVKSCGSEAEIEGAYRLLRNEQVECEAIAESGFKACAEQASLSRTLLALEDSTSLSFGHGVRDELGPVGGAAESQLQGFMVHSVLLVDADTRRTIGLIEQQRWKRRVEEHGKKHRRKQRPYEEKESYKWERASRATSERLGELMARTISVCDRESDIYDYLKYKLGAGQRFVVRASQNRRIADEESGRLFELTGQLQSVGCYDIAVPQKGGRQGRVAKMELRTAAVTLVSPKQGQPALSLNVVECREVTQGQGKGLKWTLLTQEPVTTAEQAREIVSHYEQRWRIEEFHLAWKSGGTQVEQQRMQTADNLERMSVMLAFVAVRLLQLREAVMDKAEAKQRSCTEVLQPMEWKLLWRKREPRRRLPAKPPSLHWAYYAVAKLGGWYDSKRTGKVSWTPLWEGWFRLQHMAEGAELAASLK